MRLSSLIGSVIQDHRAACTARKKTAGPKAGGIGVQPEA
jgi:hypothetical protein